MLISCFTKFRLQFCLITNLHFFEETLSFVWLKTRPKMFVLNLRKVSLIKYIHHKNIKMECGEPFYKKVDVIFISEHFDWVQFIIWERDWMNYF